MLTKAGYDPQGMSDMFGRLMNASRLNEGMGGGSWASTHPLSIERMSDVQNRARSQPPTRHVDSDDFWYIRAKMRVVQGRDAVSLRSAAQQLQDEARALSGVRKSAAYYGLALQALQRNSLAEAERNWTLASEDGRSSPQLAKLSVDIALARKDNARALELAQAASKRWPDRRALGIAYAQALQNSGRHAEAQDYLRGKIRQWGADEPSLYQMLAQSQERTGKPVQARRDMARYYTQIGAFAAAESQLQQARGCLPTSTSSRRSTCRSRKSGTSSPKNGSCWSDSNPARGRFRRSGPGAGAASSGAPERRRSGNRRGRRRRAGAAARWPSIPRAWAGRWPG